MSQAPPEPTGRCELTELPTHAALVQTLAREQGQAFPAAMGWLAIDIDRLQDFTAEVGWRASDDALVCVAVWLRSHAQALGGQVWRVGGDEFLVAVPSPAAGAMAELGRVLVDSCTRVQLHLEFRDQSPPELQVNVVLLPDDRTALLDRTGLCTQIADLIWQGKLAQDRTRGVMVDARA